MGTAAGAAAVIRRVLLATAVLQALALVLLWAGRGPALLVTPYFRLGPPEPAWRAAAPEAQDALLALRNRIHALNVEAARDAARRLRTSPAR